MSLAQKSLQSARIIYAALLFAALAYVVVAAYASNLSTGRVPMAVVEGIGIAALSLLTVGVFFRLKFVQPGAEKLRANPDDETGARIWRTGTIVSLVFAESIVMIGLTVKLIGVSWNQSAIFYVAGILVMLAWWPKLDLRT